jgi:hypothetical protein
MTDALTGSNHWGEEDVLNPLTKDNSKEENDVLNHNTVYVFEETAEKVPIDRTPKMLLAEKYKEFRSLSKEYIVRKMFEDGFKYFVLKIDDFLASLDDEEIKLFNIFLYKHENYRESKGKRRTNSFWVVNRDEPYAPKVRELINTKGGTTTGRVCPGCSSADGEHTFGVDCTLVDEEY